ncbi:hypothetical protein ACOME3_007700 [Neoechinorhynchus agilis]
MRIGQLGLGNLDESHEPELVSIPKPVRIMGVGGWHVICVSGQNVFGWGWNRCHQLTNTDDTVVCEPIPIVSVEIPTRIVCGKQHSILEYEINGTTNFIFQGALIESTSKYVLDVIEADIRTKKMMRLDNAEAKCLGVFGAMCLSVFVFKGSVDRLRLIPFSIG